MSTDEIQFIQNQQACTIWGSKANKLATEHGQLKMIKKGELI